jgi:Rrf2 family protein
LQAQVSLDFYTVTIKVTVMATNNQFSIAVHMMSALGYTQGMDVTSANLAKSLNTSPSFVRRTLSKLSKANLVSTTKGKLGKCSLARPAKEISLLEIYQAVEAPKAFSIHAYPTDQTCPVSCGIKSSLENVLGKTQRAMEESLQKVKLSEVIADMK